MFPSRAQQGKTVSRRGPQRSQAIEPESRCTCSNPKCKRHQRGNCRRNAVSGVGKEKLCDQCFNSLIGT